ncbi:hypothetical protein BGZ81_010808 [Podila clonocystis]|nr:hypothetical protein BGZ81_010808 [Podila clonocystis]
MNPTPRYTILVTIVEGRYFIRDPDCQLMVQCQFNDALFIENPETNSHSYPEILSTDPVEQTPYPIWDTELAWDLDAEVLDILRIEHASLKLNCFTINQKTNEEETLGHIILDLSTAFESESADEHWEALTGSSTAGFRGLQPELKIAFSIDDGITEEPPTIDTLLTSIESSGSVSEDERHNQQRPVSRFGKVDSLEELEEEDEEVDQYQDEDEDAHVPSLGDKSFYHGMDDPDEVPRSDSNHDMMIDIPVEIGEALIPTEVNDNGFLQLGLGRDFFIFTITIQTTRNIERMVNQYAQSIGKDMASVQQGLYLYYSFLGNDVATQLLTNQTETGAPIEEVALRLKSSMESMYQQFRDGEHLVINVCHDSNLIGTANIPLAVILLHGTANLFHASPEYYPFESNFGAPESSFIQVAMHVTRDLNTLSIPSTPAIRRSSQGGTTRRTARPVAIEVDTSRNVASSNSSRSPRRHDYKFSIELQSFKSTSRNLTNVSLRYNYRPFGPKSTQPPINVPRHIQTALPDASRNFQLCQTPEALRNQLKTPLVVEVWCQHPETHQNVQHASGQIHLIEILDEPSLPTDGGRTQRLQSKSAVVLEDGTTPVGEIRFACSLEDLGEYFDSQQSEILSTTPVHSMELHHNHRHSRGFSDDMSSSGPDPQYGFNPRGNFEVVSEEDEHARQPTLSHFAEGYSDSDRMELTTAPGRTSQRPTSVRLSQVRHLSQAHQNSHPHHHHPYGKPASPSGKNDPPMDYQTALKQQLTKQAEMNRQVEYDLLRRSPISSLPHSLQQSLQAEKSTDDRLRPSALLGDTSAGNRSILDALEEDSESQGQTTKQKMKDLKALDYQVQKQLIALEFRERKLLRAEEALARQQTNFQKVLDRHGYSQGTFHHPDQPISLQSQPSSMKGSAPSPQDYFLLQDRFRALQRQNQLLQAEFDQYRQEHPAHINMTSVNALHQTVAELESTNSKLQNDVTFANNYKEHYKALWTHSLQEIASMRQDLQMGMEFKMMQQFNEVDQLKLMGMTRAEADHGQDRIILRGIKTELEMLQHQMQPSFPDDDMSWELPPQEVPSHSLDHHGSGRDDDGDADGSQIGSRRGGHSGGQQFSFGQSKSQPQQQQGKGQQQYRGQQLSSDSGYIPFPGNLVESSSSMFNNHNPVRFTQPVQGLNMSSSVVQDDEEEEQEDTTLVDTTLMRAMQQQQQHQIQMQLQQLQLQQQKSKQPQPQPLTQHNGGKYQGSLTSFANVENIH